MRAVIPAAGLGTRMLSVTQGTAKELLPLGRETIIEHVLGIAFEHCDHAVVVWDLNKGQLPDGIAWVPQMPQRGLAAAIASGVSTEETNLVLLPDAVFPTGDPVTEMASMPDVDIVLALSHVSDDDVSKYGVCEIDPDGWVTKMLEKPSAADTLSRWAITGRYRLSPVAAELLVTMVSESPIGGPEIDMSPYFALALNQGLKIAGCFLDESCHRFDCGDPEGYREAAEYFKQ